MCHATIQEILASALAHLCHHRELVLDALRPAYLVLYAHQHYIPLQRALLVLEELPFLTSHHITK